MAPKRSSLTSRVIAIALVLGLALQSGLAVPGLAQEVGEGSIHGVLYQADGRSRLAGARVAAISVTTGERYVGDLSGENGAFEVPALPASTYDIVVEIGPEVFFTGGQVAVGAGQDVSLAYTLKAERSTDGRVVRTAQRRTTTASAGAEGFWSSPGGLAIIWLMIAGASIAITNALEDDDASPSSP